MIYKRAGTTYADLNYSYDLLGRRVRLTGSLARAGMPQTITTATYDAANQLTNWNGAAQSYDANGNLTSDGTNTYTWNARNQLSSISGATTASFGYDAMNRRTQKTIAGVTTQFMYDGDNAVKEIKGAQSATLFGSGTDRFFSRTDSAGERVMLTDGLGSVLGLVDGAGNTTTSYTYDAFGGTSVSGTASDNANQYTSRENDGTGLYFYRARYYQPKIGRFISQDPIGFRAGVNFYGYVNGNPTNNTDPSGLCANQQIVPPPPVCIILPGGGGVSCPPITGGGAPIGGGGIPIGGPGGIINFPQQPVVVSKTDDDDDEPPPPRYRGTGPCTEVCATCADKALSCLTCVGVVGGAVGYITWKLVGDLIVAATAASGAAIPTCYDRCTAAVGSCFACAICKFGRSW